jgi:hypothetical protein
VYVDCVCTPVGSDKSTLGAMLEFHLYAMAWILSHWRSIWCFPLHILDAYQTGPRIGSFHVDKAHPSFNREGMQIIGGNGHVSTEASCKVSSPTIAASIQVVSAIIVTPTPFLIMFSLYFMHC